jgi:hypothetical protein
MGSLPAKVNRPGGFVEWRLEIIGLKMPDVPGLRDGFCKMCQPDRIAYFSPPWIVGLLHRPVVEKAVCRMETMDAAHPPWEKGGAFDEAVENGW